MEIGCLFVPKGKISFVKSTIRVRVPATTANVGPGFDTLGIALRLYNHVDLKLAKGTFVKFESRLPTVARSGARAMLSKAADAFFERSGERRVGFSIRVHGDVPTARGLGSSVTIRLGVVAGLNRLLGSPLDRQEVLEVVSALEGHPDNAVPATFGGMSASAILTGGRVVYQCKALPARLKFVAIIPDFEVETRKARKLLPLHLSREDAVHNLNRAALLVAAFWSGDFTAISDFLEDRIHQPPRSRLIPQLFPCLNAARLAGAIGGWLSGSGSTVMAMTQEDPGRVGAAMRRIFQESGHACRVVVTESDNQGITFI